MRRLKRNILRRQNKNGDIQGRKTKTRGREESSILSIIEFITSLIIRSCVVTPIY